MRRALTTATAVAAALAAGLALGALPAASAPVCTATWDGGGATDSWNLAANWDTNILPGAGANVCIPAGGRAEHTSGTTMIASLQGGGTVLLAGGQLQITADTDAALQHFEMTGGTLTGAGRFAVSGDFSWTGGSLAGSGTTEVQSGATLLIGPAGGTVFLDGGRTLRVAGTATWSAGAIALQGTSLFDVMGTLRANSETGQISNSGGLDAQVHVGGTLRKDTGTGTTVIGALIDNDGTVSAQTGTLRLDRGVPTAVQTGSFGATDASAHVRLGALFSQFLLGPGATLTGGVELVLGVFTVSGPVTVSGQGNKISSGDILGGGTLSVTGELVWVGGSMAGTGTTAIRGSGQLSIEAAASFGVELEDSRTLRVEGNATWLNGAVRLDDAARIENLGVFDARADGAQMTAFASRDAEFFNGGTLTKTTGTGTVNVTVPLINDGLLDVRSGRLRVDESFGNAHSQTRDGRQHVQVRGPLAGTNFGVLQVPGKARLNGTLEIETTGFSPALNAEVKVIEYGSRSGEFSDVTGAAIGNGLVWRVRYDPTGVTLVADNPPPTLLGTGVVLPNRAPVARGESYRLQAGGVLRLAGRRGLLANDRDPDGDRLRVRVLERSPAARRVRINRRNGALSWRAPSKFRGTAWLRYRVIDALGHRSRPVKLRIRVGS